MDLKEMVGQDLAGFSVQELTEVLMTDVEGRGKTKSLGYFRNGDIAEAFAGIQTDAPWYKVAKAIVLTNGSIGFLLAGGESVTLVDDEEAALAVREAAMAKLSAAERRVLRP